MAFRLKQLEFFLRNSQLFIRKWLGNRIKLLADTAQSNWISINVLRLHTHSRIHLILHVFSSCFLVAILLWGIYASVWTKVTTQYIPRELIRFSYRIEVYGLLYGLYVIIQAWLIPINIKQRQGPVVLKAKRSCFLENPVIETEKQERTRGREYDNISLNRLRRHIDFWPWPADMTIKLFQAAWKSCLSSKPLVVRVRKWAQTSSMQVSTAFHTVQFHLVHVCYFQKHFLLAEVKNKVVPIIKYLPSRELCTQTGSSVPAHQTVPCIRLLHWYPQAESRFWETSFSNLHILVHTCESYGFELPQSLPFHQWYGTYPTISEDRLDRWACYRIDLQEC